MSDSMRPHRRQPTRCPCPWDSPGKNTGVGCHCLLQIVASVQSLSRVRLFATPWTAAYQTPPSMGFSRQESWTGVPLPSPGTTHKSLEKSHGWRSLVGCSPWGWEESDMAERLHFHFSLSCVREGNGNPLQCSCLENPRDGGA